MAERREKIILGLARFLRGGFFRFKFPTANLVGYIACDLGISADVALLVEQCSKHYFGFKSRSIFADARALIPNISSTGCFAEIALRLSSRDVVRRVEARKIFPDNFLGCVPFDFLCA